MKKMLVVYYSWSNGNTKRIAEWLAKETGADTCRIETEKPYKGTYEEVVDQGQREVQKGYTPPLKPAAVDLDAYDAIALGTPTWWYTMAPTMLSFIRSRIWTGRTVIPFMTCGGWTGHVISDIEKECKGARFVEPKEILFDSTGGSDLVTGEEEIEEWIARVKEEIS